MNVRNTIPPWEDGAHDERSRKKAEKALKLLQSHPDIGPLLTKEARTGVVLCTAPIDRPDVKYKTQIGIVTEEEGRIGDVRSGEQVDRLSKHPDHVASSQSRGDEQSGGAIRGSTYVWSIFGLKPDDYNELMAALTAVGMKDLSKAEAYDILLRTKNSAARFFFKFADVMEK